MPKHLFNLNVVLGAIAAGLAAYIAWEVVRPGQPVASSARPKSGAPTAVATLPSSPPPEPASSWTVIASRNPFSPSRSEAPATLQAGAAAAANIPKPNLYGVVLKDGAPFAYIEDPQTKRVAAYRIGDAVAGGTLEKIARDGIVLTRPDGVLDVRLHDPNKPRPALPSPPAAAVPAGSPAQAPMPGVIPPAAAQQPQQPPPPAEAPPPEPPAAAQSGEQQQQPPTVQRSPVRRPLPPNLLRRLPQTPPQGDDQNR